LARTIRAALQAHSRHFILLRRTKVLGLTIHHPYAQAIACALKKIETRGQRTRYRGRLVIHAALGHALPPPLADLDGVLVDCRSAGVEPYCAGANSTRGLRPPAEPQ